MTSEIIKDYPRDTKDWKYIDFLESKIKVLQEELKIEKKRSSKYNYDYLYLKCQVIPELESKINYYKQSLL